MVRRFRCGEARSIVLTNRTGWGGIFAVMLMRRLGRLPILFWSQVLAMGWLIGCTFAPNLKTFTGEFIVELVHLILNKTFNSDAMLERILRDMSSSHRTLTSCGRSF